MLLGGDMERAIPSVPVRRERVTLVFPSLQLSKQHKIKQKRNKRMTGVDEDFLRVCKKRV